MPSNHRPLLRPSELIMTAVVVSLLATIGSAQIFGIRENARRRTCSNNLRQLALGVHNYQDVTDTLPPLATDEGHWTWVALLLPYVERADVHGKIDFVQPAKAEKNKELVAAFKMPELLCPSRRGKDTLTRKEGDFKGGQPSDYVAVSTTVLKKFGPTDGMIVYRAAPPDKERGLRGLRSQTTIGSVPDGLSNTAMVGEKHMLADWLGGRYDEPALVALNDQNTIRLAGITEKDKADGKEVEKLRGLAADDKDKDDWKFGSAHSDACFFALGDASARPISNRTDPKILRLLLSRNDGQAFELPD